MKLRDLCVKISLVLVVVYLRPGKDLPRPPMHPTIAGFVLQSLVLYPSTTHYGCSLCLLPVLQ